MLVSIRVLALSLAAFAAIPASSQDVGRPNIVFLLADDLGYGDLGCYGSPVIETPNLDRLAEQGVRLTDCYAASPNCSPARTAILTGRMPYRVGMYDFVRYAPMHIPEAETTIAEVLGEAGYATMFAGKWHCSGRFGKQPGPSEHGFDHWFAHSRNFGKDPAGFVRNGEKLGKQSGWMSELVVDEAIGWLEGREDRDEPFFACLWFSEPHSPVVAPEEFTARYLEAQPTEAARGLDFGGPQVVRRKADWEQRQRYFGCVTMLDHHIGRLLAWLDRAGLAENTIVVFTSDNGPEHRLSTAFGSPGGLRGAKGHMHEGGIRVPGIVRWPGRIEPRDDGTPVNGTDWLPTLCRAAGAGWKAERTVDGADVFASLVERQAVDRPIPMMWWLWHARGGCEVAMRIGDEKMLATMLPQPDPGGIDDSRHPEGWTVTQFIKQAELGRFALYDVRADRAETEDLRTRRPDRFEAMRDRLIALHREIRDEGPTYELRSARRRK